MAQHAYLGDRLAIEADYNASDVLIAMLDVEINLENPCVSRRISAVPQYRHGGGPYLMGDLGPLGGLRRLSEENKGNRKNQQDRDNESLNRRHLVRSQNVPIEFEVKSRTGVLWLSWRSFLQRGRYLGHGETVSPRFEPRLRRRMRRDPRSTDSLSADTTSTSIAGERVTKW